jgi:hypothetical protein
MMIVPRKDDSEKMRLKDKEQQEKHHDDEQ